MLPSIHILDYDIELYNIFNFLAVCMIIILGIRWNYKYGPKYPIGISIILFVAPSAFILGRIIFFIFLAAPSIKLQFFNFQEGGSMFIGAFSGGLLGALLYFEIKRIPLIKGLEILIPYTPIGGILGRIGCFCAGCCSGTVSNSLFALRFPQGSAVWAEQFSNGLISSNQFFSLPVHPTQLYEIAMWIIIALILIPLRHSNPRKGVITLSFLIFYFLSRFFEDFFRADYPKIYLGLDGMQWLAILTIPLSILGLLILYQDTLFSKLIVKSAKK